MSSSVSPLTGHHTAGVDRPTNQSTVTCNPDSDPEVIYDDVPAESLQQQVEGDHFVPPTNHTQYSAHFNSRFNSNITSIDFIK